LVVFAGETRRADVVSPAVIHVWEVVNRRVVFGLAKARRVIVPDRVAITPGGWEIVLVDVREDHDRMFETLGRMNRLDGNGIRSRGVIDLVSAAGVETPLDELDDLAAV